MNTKNNFIRHGLGTVRPYLYGYLDLPEFVKQAFDGKELENAKTGDNDFHVEMQIGDSVVVLEVGEPDATTPRAAIYLYVPDVDTSYQKALKAGAMSLAAPSDKPYQERSAEIKDSFGNTWYISTYTGQES